MGKEIYVRAKPKSMTFTENYYYSQNISRNSSIEQKNNPEGKIEVLIPYDGYEYFIHQATRDAERQIKDRSSDEELNALIGYLAISDHDKTNLEDMLSRHKKYESIPLSVPIRNSNFPQTKQLISEQNLCILEHSYQPSSPELLPVQVSVEVLDDDISLGRLPYPKKLSEKLDIAKVKDLIDIVTKHVSSGFTFGDASFRNILVLLFRVRLSLPVGQSIKLIPKIRKFSLRWPTSPSLSNLDLAINALVPNKKIEYDPLIQSLQWVDIKFEQDRQNQNGIWQSEPMCLLIGQPSELYQEASLNGEIEVEVPGHLLSGVQARFYGSNHEDTKKVGELNGSFPRLSTRIITNFELILDDAFQGRIKSTSQELKFDQVFPDEECIRIITNELKAQGFSVFSPQQLPIASSGNREELKWLISADRTEGIDPMHLWIVVHGIKFETERATLKGEAKFTTIVKSGELKMYILGQFPRNSHGLISKMKALQEELRKKFEKLQYGN